MDKSFDVQPDAMSVTDSSVEEGGFPESPEDIGRLQESLDKAMAAMSLDEEEQILFDLYGFPPGIGDITEGSPPGIDVFETTGNIHDSGSMKQRKAQNESLQHLMQEVDRKLQKGVADDVKTAYNRALQSNPQFFHQQGLLFVSAVKKGSANDFVRAADMVLQHLRSKAELFPLEALGRHILWSDLSSREQNILASGFLQYAPRPDAHGRVVIHWSSHVLIRMVGRHWDEETSCAVARVYWYFIMRALQTNARMLNNGVLVTVCNICDTTVSVRSMSAFQKRIFCLPYRLRAQHCFYTYSRMQGRYLFMEVFFLVRMVVFRRFRTRTHFVESLSDLKVQLASFGIDSSPWDRCSLDGTGWSCEHHMEWLRRQRLFEDQQTPESSSAETALSSFSFSESEIRPQDVLLGKQRKCREHPGTKQCKTLVANQHNLYERSDWHGKSMIANKIIDTIYESGGRFLVFDGKVGAWRQVSSRVARQKVTHNFRFIRDKGNIDRMTSDLASR